MRARTIASAGLSSMILFSCTSADEASALVSSTPLAALEPRGLTASAVSCLEPPTLESSPPARVDAVEGSPVVLDVRASGEALRYQWQAKYENEPAWTDLPGETSPRLSLVAPGIGPFCRSFRCVVSNDVGSVTTAPTQVFPRRATPVLALDLPETLTVPEGEVAELRVDTAGTAGLVIWYRVGDSAGYYNGPTYRTAPLRREDDGVQYYAVAVSQSGNHVCGADAQTKSRVVTIRVRPPVP